MIFIPSNACYVQNAERQKMMEKHIAPIEIDPLWKSAACIHSFLPLLIIKLFHQKEIKVISRDGSSTTVYRAWCGRNVYNSIEIESEHWKLEIALHFGIRPVSTKQSNKTTIKDVNAVSTHKTHSKDAEIRHRINGQILWCDMGYKINAINFVSVRYIDYKVYSSSDKMAVNLMTKSLRTLAHLCFRFYSGQSV